MLRRNCRHPALAPLALLALSACAQPDSGVVWVEPHYATCARRPPDKATVEVDSQRRLLICATQMTNDIGEYRATPVVLRVADTIFVSALVDLPDNRGPNPVANMVSSALYAVYYGPLPKGARIRVTNRRAGAAPEYVPLLDTLVRIP